MENITYEELYQKLMHHPYAFVIHTVKSSPLQGGILIESFIDFLMTLQLFPMRVYKNNFHSSSFHTIDDTLMFSTQDIFAIDTDWMDIEDTVILNPRCQHIKSSMPLSNMKDSSHKWYYCTKCGDWLERVNERE